MGGDIRGLAGLPNVGVRQFAHRALFAIEAFIARTRTFARAAEARTFSRGVKTRTFARAAQARTFARVARTRTYDFTVEARDDG